MAQEQDHGPVNFDVLVEHYCMAFQGDPKDPRKGQKRMSHLTPPADSREVGVRVARERPTTSLALLSGSFGRDRSDLPVRSCAPLGLAEIDQGSRGSSPGGLDLRSDRQRLR